MGNLLLEPELLKKGGGHCYILFQTEYIALYPDPCVTKKLNNNIVLLSVIHSGLIEGQSV